MRSVRRRPRSGRTVVRRGWSLPSSRGAYATARLLAVLPFGVLLLGSGIGGDPVGFLAGSTAGLVCLALGIGLSFSGLLWLERIAGRVLRR